MKKLIILGVGVALLGAGFVGAEKLNTIKVANDSKKSVNFTPFAKLKVEDKKLARFLSYRTAEIFDQQKSPVVLVFGENFVLVEPIEYKSIEATDYFRSEKKTTFVPLMGIPQKFGDHGFFVYCGWKASQKKQKTDERFVVAMPYPVDEKSRKKVVFFVEGH